MFTKDQKVAAANRVLIFFFNDLLHYFFIYPLVILVVFSIIVDGNLSISAWLNHITPKIELFMTYDDATKAGVLAFHFSKFMVAGAILLILKIGILSAFKKSEFPTNTEKNNLSSNLEK